MKLYSLKKQAFYLFSGKTAGYIIASFLPLIMVRLLTTHQFGVYRQILFVAAISITLIRLRIVQSLYYFYPRESDRIGSLISNTLVILAAAGFTGVLCFLAVTLIFKILPSGVTAVAVLPLAAYVFIETIAQLIDHIFVLDKKPGLVIAAAVSCNITRVVLVAGTFIVFRTVLSIVYALIVLTLIRLGTVMVYLFRHYIIRILPVDKALFTRQVRYVSPLAVGSFAGFMASQVGRFVISGYMRPEDFAVFAVGSIGILSILSILYVSLGNVCSTRLGEFAVTDNFSAAAQLWHRMILINALFTVPIVVFCWVFADKITVLLFTAKYLKSVWIWRIHMLSLPVLMLGYGYIPRSFGRTRAVMNANISSFIFSVSSVFILIDRFGISGAAMCTVIGIWINALIQLRAGKHALRREFTRLLPWRKLAYIFLVCICGGVLLVYLKRLDLANELLFFIGALVYFPVVFLVLFMLSVVEYAEFKQLFARNSAV